MKSAIPACVLGVCALSLVACQSGGAASSSASMTSARTASSGVIVTNGSTPVVVMGGRSSANSNLSAAGNVATAAMQTVNAAAYAVQGVNPSNSNTNVQTTDPGLVVVQRQSNWVPFPAVAPRIPNVYVVGGGGTVQSVQSAESAQPAPGVTVPNLNNTQVNQAAGVVGQYIAPR